MKLDKRHLILFLSLHSISLAFLCAAHGLRNAQRSEDEGSFLHLRSRWNLNLPIPERRLLAISEGNSTYILAEQRTRRKDPLNGFKLYTGGWNISDKHYWASVGFSAASIFAIAAVWFILFGIVLFLVICCFCCCPGRNYSYPRAAYMCSLSLLIVFTVAAIPGCFLLYDGQENFHESITSTMNYIQRQATDTVSNLRTLSDNLDAAKSVHVDQFFLSSDTKQKIDKIVTKINVSTNDLESQTSRNSNKIEDVLNSMKMTLIVLIAAMLSLTFLGLVFYICGLQTLIYILAIVGWILITSTLMLCGVFLLLHNIVSDTCVALDEWVQHPQDHTALDDILPCVDPAMTNETIQQSELVVYQIIDLLNDMLANVSNKDFPPQAIPMYYNQSGPLVPQLCNPYSADLNLHICAPEELHFDNAAQVKCQTGSYLEEIPSCIDDCNYDIYILEVWKQYICETTNASGSEICTTIGRLTPEFYNQMSVAVNVTFGLYHYGPYLSDLASCNFVRRTFNSISDNNCPDLSRYSNQVYISFLIVSISVILSLILWIVYARKGRHKKKNEEFVRLDQKNRMSVDSIL